MDVEIVKTFDVGGVAITRTYILSLPENPTETDLRACNEAKEYLGSLPEELCAGGLTLVSRRINSIVFYSNTCYSEK